MVVVHIMASRNYSPGGQVALTRGGRHHMSDSNTGWENQGWTERHGCKAFGG
jgi:hypothetical protein